MKHVFFFLFKKHIAEQIPLQPCKTSINNSLFINYKIIFLIYVFLEMNIGKNEQD